MTRPKVLLVGAGLTSATIANIISLRMPGAIDLVIWDKALRPGGRLTTHMAPKGSGVIHSGSVDLGAQYISSSQRYNSRHSHFYNELINAGLLKHKVSNSNVNTSDLQKVVEGQLGPIRKGLVQISLDDQLWESEDDEYQSIRLVRTKNFVTPVGTELIVNHFLDSSGAKVKSLHGLKQLDLEGGHWVACARGSSGPEQFDCVISTLPVPQLLGEPPAPEGIIGGNFIDVIKEDTELLDNLNSVKFNSVFCLGLFYNQTLDLGWSAKYFPEDPVIRYVSFDNLKRGEKDTPSCIVAQSHVSFAKEHLAWRKQDMLEPLMSHLNNLLPNLPSPSGVMCHKWRYCQTSQPYPGSPGCVILGRGDRGPLIAAGDSFTHSNMDGCLASAFRVVDTLQLEFGL